MRKPGINFCASTSAAWQLAIDPRAPTSAEVAPTSFSNGSWLGPIAKPRQIMIVPELPKTRSGKIMRRLLRSIAKGEDITQDTSTLENPAILEQLKQAL